MPAPNSELDRLSAIVPRQWEADPAAQLQALRDEVVRQRNFPVAGTAAFMAAALKAIQSLPRAYAPATKVDALINIATFTHLEDEREAAARVIASAIEAAELGGHRSLEARARKVHATILKTLYQLGASLNEFAHALELARADGNVVEERMILNNFAGWYSAAGQNVDALEIYEQLAVCHQGDQGGSMLGGLLMALSNGARSALDIGDVAKAMLLIERARPLIADPATADEKLRFVQHALTYCELLILAGRDEEAAVRADEAMSMASSPGCPGGARVLAAIAQGIAAFPADPHAIDRSVALAKSESKISTEVALDAAFRVYEHRGFLDKALAIQYERIGFQQTLKFSEVRQILGKRSAEEAEGVAKAAQLEGTIDRIVAELVSAAVCQTVRAGYDHARSFRVSRLAELFALSEGWSAQSAQALGLAAKLIDVGMMVVPADLLMKPRELLKAERQLVWEHARFGADLLHSARLEILEPCIPVVRLHHEWWDGSGPARLKESAIPCEARMVALCDCFDALTHTRPWRAALPNEIALRTIAEEAGSHFDPQLAVSFVGFVRRQAAASRDLDAHLATEAWENEFIRARLRVEDLLRSQRKPSAAWN